MGHRRRRILAAAAAALALLLLVGWWMTREPARAPAPVGLPEPPPDVLPPETVPGSAAAGSPAAEPVPNVTAVVRAVDGTTGRPAEATVFEVETLLDRGPVAAREPSPGTLEIEGPPGTVVRVIADAAGYVPAERAFTLDRWPRLELALCPVGTLQVRVVGGKEGKPVPGARVHVDGEPLLFRHSNAVRHWDGRTDGEGWVACPEGGPGRDLTVTVTADGFAPAVLRGEAPPEGIVVALEPSVIAEVVVVDERGSPVEGARLLPLRLDGSPSLPARLAFTTGEDGRANVLWPESSGTGAGFTLLATARARNPAVVRGIGMRDGRASVRIVLEREVPVGVTVLDADGAPLLAVPVRASPLAAPRLVLPDGISDGASETGADGRAALGPLPAGERHLVAVGGVSSVPLASRVFAVPDLRTFPEFRLPSAETRRIRVTAPDGGPGPGAAVAASWADPPREFVPREAGEASTESDATGHAVLRLVPGSVASVVAFAGPALVGAVRLAGGEEEETTVALRAPGRLRVSVAGVGGDSLPAATVVVRPLPDGGAEEGLLRRFVQRGWTGPDGTILFEVPGGIPLQVEASSAGALNARRAETTVPEGGNGTASLALGIPRRVWVVFVDRTGRRAPGTRVEVRVPGLTNPWLVRGTADERGILGIHLPPVDYRPPGWEDVPDVVFLTRGTVEGSAIFPNPQVVDNLHVRGDGTADDVAWIRLEESTLFPDGTPFSWFLRRRGQEDPFLSGAARVGDEVPLPLRKRGGGTLEIRLPGAVPLALEGLADRFIGHWKAWREAEERRLLDEMKQARSREEIDDLRNRILEVRRRPVASDSAVLPIPLPSTPATYRNPTGARARLRFFRADGGVPAWSSRPVAAGASVAVAVPTWSGFRHEWVPAE